MTKTKIRQLISLAAVAFIVIIIFSFSLQPGSSSHHESSLLATLLQKIMRRLNISVNGRILEIYQPFVVDGGKVDFEEFVRKTAHVIEYAVLGLLTVAAYLTVRKACRKSEFLVITGPAVALFDERVIQKYLVVNRTSSYKDVLLDSIAFYLVFVLGLLAAALYRFCRKRLCKEGKE